MNIIDLAKQAEEYANNVVQSNDNDYSWGFLRDQKFAALVEATARADEREACAKVCDGLADTHEKLNNWSSHKTADTLAQAIRARGTT